MGEEAECTGEHIKCGEVYVPWVVCEAVECCGLFGDNKDIWNNFCGRYTEDGVGREGFCEYSLGMFQDFSFSWSLPRPVDLSHLLMLAMRARFVISCLPEVRWSSDNIFTDKDICVIWGTHIQDFRRRAQQGQSNIRSHALRNGRPGAFGFPIPSRHHRKWLLLPIDSCGVISISMDTIYFIVIGLGWQRNRIKRDVHWGRGGLCFCKMLFALGSDGE